jgi:hypothetical protein
MVAPVVLTRMRLTDWQGVSDPVPLTRLLPGSFPLGPPRSRGRGVGFRVLADQGGPGGTTAHTGTARASKENEDKGMDED